MGFMKSQLMEEEERGFRSAGDRGACPDCVGEVALAGLVRRVADSPRCSYCGATDGGPPIALSTDTLLEAIADGLRCEYGDPADELPYEGGYIGITMDTLEVLDDAGCEIENSDLLDAVARAFHGRLWCRRNYFQLPDGDALAAGWERFAYEAKHVSRYFFLSRRHRERARLDSELPDALGTLEGIGRAVSEADLVRLVPAGTRWYRARAHGPGEVPPVASELGPPPERKAAANRMSAAGVPMFYGARDPETAVAEVVSVPQNAIEPVVTVGTFVTARDSWVVDLTGLPEVPSLFDADRRHLREPVRFLREFSHQLSQPISRDGHEHIEYVPTQVVTEWFREEFEAEEGVRVSGLVYVSARRAGGACCVLFADGSAVCDEVPGWQGDPAKLLALESAHSRAVHEGYLRLLASGELEKLRADGLCVLERHMPFEQEEWWDFVAQNLPRSPEYEAFGRQCQEVAARFGLYEYVVRSAALIRDYSPESEPFAIASVRPRAWLAVRPGLDPLFQDWLTYAASNVGIGLILPGEAGGEARAFVLPLPEGPSQPLTPGGPARLRAGRQAPDRAAARLPSRPSCGVRGGLGGAGAPPAPVPRLPPGPSGVSADSGRTAGWCCRGAGRRPPSRGPVDG